MLLLKMNWVAGKKQIILHKFIFRSQNLQKKLLLDIAMVSLGKSQTHMHGKKANYQPK